MRRWGTNYRPPTCGGGCEQQVQADAIVPRLLAPFIAERGMVREEWGRVRAEYDGATSQLLAQAETIAELRRRA